MTTTATFTQQMRWVCGRGYLFGQPVVDEIVWETCLKTVFMFEVSFIDDIGTGITHFNFEKRKWEGSFYLVFISGLFSAIYVSHYSCENNMWFINLRFRRESLTSLFYEAFLMKPNPINHFLVIFEMFSAGCPTVNSLLSVFLLVSICKHHALLTVLCQGMRWWV